ncbi:hypothetical protein [Streptacidiphilus rugosus]|uniref:hypothetical protein n=1 Tax=Streptacidiphilus rugosus TaxID=405783 RepID=UPI0007C69199|nr:hypothetical protein [Streptacidiphilus rugosus]
MTTPPLAPLPLWEQVIHRADGRCQCTGQCGSKHAAGHGRCEHENGGYLSKHHGPVRLIAAPADPAALTLPAHQAARLPLSALAAWCPPCHDHAHTRARHAHRQTLADQHTNDAALFDL